MTGTFSRYEDLRNKVPGAFQALLYCFTHEVCIKGECIEWLIDNYSELVVDAVYDDFEESGRWSISKSYILKIDDDYYRVWEEVGLTEMQPNEWWDQIPQKVVQRERTITEWITVKEA